jgi:hypothetical protein
MSNIRCQQAICRSAELGAAALAIAPDPAPVTPGGDAEQDRLDKIDYEAAEEMRCTVRKWIRALGGAEPLIALICEESNLRLEGVRASWEFSYQIEPGIEF